MENSPNESIQELANYLKNNVWSIEVELYWTSPYDFAEMKKRDSKLYAKLSEAKLAIFKGDLNYRKLLGDINWEYTTEFRQSLRGFHPDVVKRILGEISFSLYTMESMAYLTTGMIDDYKDMNADLERIITETYCANSCLKCIQIGLQLVGARSYINNQSYIEAFHDAMALTTIDTNNLDANTYVAVSVFQFLGQTMHDHVYKKRNHFQFPLYNMFDKIFDKFVIKLDTYDYLHPTFKHSVRYMEDGINRFKKCCFNII